MADQRVPLLTDDHKEEETKEDTGSVQELFSPRTPRKEKKKKLPKNSVPLFIDGKIKMISDINVVDENFTIRFHIHLGIPVTESEAEDITEKNYMEYCPAFTYLNMEEGDKEPEFKKLSKLEQRYVVDKYWPECKKHFSHILRIKMDCTMTLYEAMELEKFPMDCQDLTIKIRCEDDKFQLTNTEFVPRGKTTDISPWFSIDRENLCLKDFELSNHCIAEFYNEDPKSNKGGRSYSHFRVRVKLQRKFPFYFWNFYLINGLLSGTSLTVFTFGFDQDGLDSRFGIIFTLLLSLIASKFTISDQVPKLSYNTLLDVYIIGNFVFVIFLTVLNSFFPVITNDDHAAFYNEMLWAVLLTLWVVGHVLYAIYGFKARKEEATKLGMNTADFNELSEVPLQFCDSGDFKKEREGFRTFISFIEAGKGEKKAGHDGIF